MLLDDLAALEYENVNQNLRHDLTRLQEQDESGGLGGNVWIFLKKNKKNFYWCVQESNVSRRPPSVFVGRHAIRLLEPFRSEEQSFGVFPSSAITQIVFRVPNVGHIA